MKKATTKSYALRIDGPLVKPLQELKKENRRSLNAEINAALEAWVASHAKPAETSPPQPQPRAKKQSKARTATVEAAPGADVATVPEAKAKAKATVAESAGSAS